MSTQFCDAQQSAAITCYSWLQSNRVLASWKRLDLAYSRLRIVAKFKAIRDNAIYEDPNRVANLREEMQENAADIWVSLRAIQDRVKEIREFLGAATDEEDSDVQDSRGDGPS